MAGSTEPIEKLAERVAAVSEPVEEDVLEIGTVDAGGPSAAAEPAQAPSAPVENVEADPQPASVPPIADKAEPQTELSRLIQQFHENKPPAAKPEAAVPARESEALSALRSLMTSLMHTGYKPACGEFLDFVSERFGLDSLFWFEIKDNRLNKVLARGPLREKTLEVGVTGDHPLFVQAAKRQLPLILRERSKSGDASKRVLNLFPVTVGNEIRAALGVEGTIAERSAQRTIARISQAVASQLEILRLRDEVKQKDWLARAVRKFNESLKTIDADDFWLRVTQVSAELLGAERASLLVRNEKSNKLQAKAAVGSLIDLLGELNIGDRVAAPALESGDPVVVTGISSFVTPAPDEWRYKSDSFITFPVSIGEQKIAVLNFTDRADGGVFGDRDVELLQAITPQIAMAIERASMKDKAGEFEQLSVTDEMTGLLNRRYLQERLSEEIQRSKRHHFPMSLMMLDVDKFKPYNDAYGHLAGDAALRIVASILKENLRGADVAARYGGEEFAILLPQTSSEEASVIAERIRMQIERTEFPHRRVTVSIGIAKTTAEVNSPDDIIWAADRALYEAKGRGRNNVQLYSDFGDSLAEKIH
jgi:diguanylate cyclase (GGDEF)-like protein